MSVSKTRCSRSFLGRISGHVAIKLWLKGRKNRAEKASIARNFHHAYLLKNKSKLDRPIRFIVDPSLQKTFERREGA